MPPLLSPIRFATSQPWDTLPSKLGLLNAPKEQELIIYAIDPDSRYEAKNYKTMFPPTNIELDFSAKERMGEFYNSLYDHIITFRHKELREAWKSIYSAEEALAKSKSASASQGKSLIGDARKLATQIAINDKRASDKEVTGAFKSKSGLKAQLETEWENFATGNYAKAKALAEKAAAMAK